MTRAPRRRMPPFAAAIGFVAVIALGSTALVWTTAAARPPVVKPWLAVLVIAIFVAAALFARRAIFNRRARASQPPSERQGWRGG